MRDATIFNDGRQVDRSVRHVGLTEHDAVLDLFAWMFDTERAGPPESAAALWPGGDWRDAARRALPGQELPRFRVQVLGEDDLSWCRTLITESVRVDDHLKRRLPRLERVIQFGRFGPRLFDGPADCEFVEFERPSIRSVAEHAVGLILALLRHTPKATADTRTVVPPVAPSRYAYNWLDIQPRLIADSRVAVLGMGQVGQAVLRALGGLRPKETIYWSRRPSADATRAGARHEPDLMRALTISDVAVLALPSTPSTRGVIGRRELAALGPEGILINVARGDLVDEGALVADLQDGSLGAAGLDVFMHEPLPADHPLRKCPNVLLTPHCAGGSRLRLAAELVELAMLAHEPYRGASRQGT